jgi:uncharacterized protein (TIGR00369 family)
VDKAVLLQNINNHVKNTMIDFLGIEFTDAGDDFLVATMPIAQHTYNPARILHGGALMALAETVGSALSYLHIDRELQDVRGLEINGNHVKSASQGKAVACAKLIHKGRNTHVSEIKITDQDGKLLNISRMTNMIVTKNA